MYKKINLLRDPIWPLLRKVTIPASIGSLFQTFYNLVDTYFAGKISPEALSALAKSFPIYFIIIAIGVGVGAATNTLIGNSIGEKNEKRASMFVGQSFLYAVFVSLLVTYVGLNISDFLLGLMGSSLENILLTREYLDIIFYCTVLVLIQTSLNGTLNLEKAYAANAPKNTDAKVEPNPIIIEFEYLPKNYDGPVITISLLLTSSSYQFSGGGSESRYS